MIYEVITTDQADEDIRGIYEYIAFELLSPDNVEGQLERLEEHIIGLEEFPEKFRPYEKDFILSKDKVPSCFKFTAW